MGCVIPFSVTTPHAPTVLQLGQSPPGTNLEFGSPGFSSSTWQHAGACSSTQEQTMLPLGNVVGVGQFVQVPAHVSVALSPVPLPVPEHRPSCGVAKVYYTATSAGFINILGPKVKAPRSHRLLLLRG